uniref:Uncharacterized protein n=1 Tax=viral metagenome TaxID=1070528 RepID=A0A6C0K0A3_9ZZZZ
MFDFIFRKKPTIFLLLAIIVISLIFSILLNQPLHEGMEDATINNPPPDLIETAYKIIQDKDKTHIEKLSEIRSLLKGKYKILGDIYRENEHSILKELTSTLSVLPKRDSEGKLYDENALVGDKRDNANKILSSNDYSAMEKIEKIKEISGKDKAIANIMEEYIQAWMKMVRENIDKLRSSSNDTVYPTPSP